MRHILIILILLALSASINAENIGYTNAVLADSPVGYWQLNESSGSTGYDSSSSGYNGTFVGGVTYSVEGPYTNVTAVTFNGNGYLNISESGSTNLDVSYLTMEAWINPGDVSGERMIMNKESTWEVAIRNGYLQSAFSSSWTWKGNYAIQTNTWTHIAVTYDGTTVRQYVNGVEVYSYSSIGALSKNDSDLRIGARGGDGGAASYFQGSIAHAAVFSTSLTGDQILDQYNAENVPEPSVIFMFTASLVGILLYKLKK